MISCICCTSASRAWCLPLAIRAFSRQTYAAWDRELVIVTDGTDADRDIVAAIASGHPGVEHYHIPSKPGATRRITLGEKRNLAIVHARGDWLCHWDDDDWHSPDRLTRAIKELALQGARAAGMTSLLFHELTGDRRTFRYRYSGKPYLVGGTMLYHRNDWRDIRFPRRQEGEDSVFAFELCRRVTVAIVDDLSHYVALRHGNNTSHRGQTNPRPPKWVQWEGDIRSIMGQDLDEYERALHGSRENQER
ncbi:MAG: glycosyltransferase family A protein [Pseudomonadota bacterium]